MVKLANLGLGLPLCLWIMDFLTSQTQRVRIRCSTSFTFIQNTGAPEANVLSPVLLTPFTHGCSPIHYTKTTVEFVGETNIVGLIWANKETVCKEEGQHLLQWCWDNSLVLNTIKAKEIFVEFRRRKRSLIPNLHIQRGALSLWRYNITKYFTWTVITSNLVRSSTKAVFTKEGKTPTSPAAPQTLTTAPQTQRHVSSQKQPHFIYS